MPKPIMFGKLDFEIVSSMEETRGVPQPETPFRIAILGDFSGRISRGISEPSSLASRRSHFIDRDNIDEVMGKLGVEIRLPMGRKHVPLALRFEKLDDFHPDQIFEGVKVFGKMRAMRSKLADPRTFAAAVEKHRGKGEKKSPAKRETDSRMGSQETQNVRAPEIAGLTSESLLDQIMEEQEGPLTIKAATEPSEWGAFIREIVQPYVVPRDDPRQAELVASLDDAASGLMRAILHHPNFQALEAAWRAVHFLVSRLETDTQLKLYLMDISKAELSADLVEAEDLRSTGLYRLLVEETVESPGGEPWAVVGGNFHFGPSREDAEMLGRIAKIARAAGAPFIAASRDSLLGCESLAQTPDPREWKRMSGAEESRAWEALRRIPEATYLGLAAPRFLLRLPYGKDTDPIEGFAFEEMTGPPEHEDYLWGNPSFACIYLLAQAFSQYGWNFRPGVVQEVEGLPLHIYKEQDESRIKPCAEVLLTERAAEIILDKGVMPLLAFRNRDILRLARFQSLKDPLSSLAGPWDKSPVSI